MKTKHIMLFYKDLFINFITGILITIVMYIITISVYLLFDIIISYYTLIITWILVWELSIKKSYKDLYKLKKNGYGDKNNG